VALREGASQWALGIGEDQRAEQLQAECETVGGQLGHAIADFQKRERRFGAIADPVTDLTEPT